MCGRALHCNYYSSFNVIIVLLGESGLGKSTLIQSLFLTNFFGDKTNPPAIRKFTGLISKGLMCCNDLYISERIKQTVSIDATTVDIEEKGVKLRLTVVDTPGFGDAVNNDAWYGIMGALVVLQCLSSLCSV